MPNPGRFTATQNANRVKSHIELALAAALGCTSDKTICIFRGEK